jgi:hypothetical protein
VWMVRAAMDAHRVTRMPGPTPKAGPARRQRPPRRRPRGPWGARSRVSCCVLVLVDQATKDIAAAQLTNGRCIHRISTHR